MAIFVLQTIPDRSTMVKHISIKNFKPLKDISFESRRVNIFIGEPNTGKSNLLEALGVFSANYLNQRSILRYRTLYDLFFDNNILEPILISAGRYTMKITVLNEKGCVTVSDTASSSLPEFESGSLMETEFLARDSNRVATA